MSYIKSSFRLIQFSALQKELGLWDPEWWWSWIRKGTTLCLDSLGARVSWSLQSCSAWYSAVTTSLLSLLLSWGLMDPYVEMAEPSDPRILDHKVATARPNAVKNSQFWNRLLKEKKKMKSKVLVYDYEVSYPAEPMLAWLEYLLAHPVPLLWPPFHPPKPC